MAILERISTNELHERIIEKRKQILAVKEKVENDIKKELSKIKDTLNKKIQEWECKQDQILEKMIITFNYLRKEPELTPQLRNDICKEITNTLEQLTIPQCEV